jgi:carboxyl-terminal processing protease
MKSQPFIYRLFTFLLVLAFGVQIGKFISPSRVPVFSSDSARENKINELFYYVDHNYVDSIDMDSLLEITLAEMLEKLDPHSNYIPAKELQSLSESMQGNFEGIGVEFQIQKDTIVVVSPISGGPSERLGILSGDRIIQVDTLNVAGVGFTNSDVVKHLRGEKGTVVTVTIKRKGLGKLLVFDIVRDKIPITSVDVSYMLDDEIGYVKVNRFAATTDTEFRQAIRKLNKEGVQSLILDLRGNPGGYLHAANSIADEFLGSGDLIVYTQGRARSKQVYLATRSGQMENKKLVVLIDEGSASASEIVAGAIQDHDRGIVIGRRTFGKGLVQEQNMLSDGSAFRLTTARYYTPSGRSIQKHYDEDVDAYHREAYARYETGEVYSEDSLKVEDSLKYFTDRGRVVYGGGGITPDIFVPLDTVGKSDWLYDLLAENIINDFVFNYVDKNRASLNGFKSARAFNEAFEIDEALFTDFLEKVKAREIKSPTHQVQHSKDWILIRIKALIARQMWNDEGFFRVVNDEDPMMQKALEVLKTNKPISELLEIN